MTYLKYLIGRVRFHLTNYFKPLIAHTEGIFIDEIWEQIKKKALKKDILKWYVMTPINYEYFKVFFNTKYSKKELAKIMKKRYKWLLERNQRLELHVHFNKIMNISYENQEEMIKNAKDWMMKELGVKPKEFISGWWVYNKDTIEILRKNNLKLIKENKYKAIHDYNLIR